jgi:hypothetical protein
VPLASEVEDAPVFGAADAEIGAVTRLLYHPAEPRVVGMMARPPAVAYVIDRTATYLPLAGVDLARPNRVGTRLKKLPSLRAGADSLGFDPDVTVIWTGMDVRGPADAVIGRIGDVYFDADSGEVRGMSVGSGAVAGAAHGVYIVPRRLIEGYRDGAVRISAEAADLTTSGGLAKTAAEALIAASEAAKSAGAAIGDGMVSASGATGKAIRKVAASGAVEKAAKSVAKHARSTWRDGVKAFRDGMNGE